MLMSGLSIVRCACGAPGGAQADPDRGFDSDLHEAGLTDAGLAFEEHERASTPRCRLDGRPQPRELCVHVRESIATDRPDRLGVPAQESLFGQARMDQSTDS